MSDEVTQRPAVSPWPEQQAQRDKFDALVKTFEAAEQQAASAAPVAGPDPELERLITNTIAATDASGQRYFEISQQFREYVEGLRMQNHAGQRFDVNEARRKIGDIIGVRTGEPVESDFVASAEVAGVQIDLPEGYQMDARSPELVGFVEHAKVAGLDGPTISKAIHAYLRSLPADG